MISIELFLLTSVSSVPKKTKGVLRKVTKCVTKYAEDFIIFTPEDLIWEVLGKDLNARELFYHNACRPNSLEVEEVKERFVSQRQANP